MAKIAIIGGGIIGMTAAYYLSQSTHDITVFDEPTGQATRASAGIICPWLSKRRNKKWYALAKDGAAFYQKLASDLHLDETIYHQTGTLIIRPEDSLRELEALAHNRKQEAPEIGEIRLLTGKETTERIPLLKEQSSLFISGGAKLNGQAYLEHVAQILKAQQVTLRPMRVQISKLTDGWQVESQNYLEAFDQVLCAPGPHLKQLLAPLGYEVTVQPQKGQLICFQTTLEQTYDWPVVMLDGEADLIPFQNGEVLLGATHENEAKWDLTPTKEAFEQLTISTQRFFKNPTEVQAAPHKIKVGTRAYTPDFSPFFGPVAQEPSLVVASGLGSSGLTTGPLIGYLLANYFLQDNWQTEHYQKELSTYIKKRDV